MAPVGPNEYAHLLGTYLGDGHIWRGGPGSWPLTVTLDRRYPGVVEEVADSIRAVDPDTTVRFNDRPGATLVVASSIVWERAFPQHAPGASTSA